jgi:hypothetical protein
VTPLNLRWPRGGNVIEENDLNLVTEWVWILFCYMLFLSQRYQPGLAKFHSLIREQFLYGQSSLPCKSFHLNGEYRYLQLLCSRLYFHMCLFRNQADNILVDIQGLFLYLKINLKRVLFSGHHQVDIQG